LIYGVVGREGTIIKMDMNCKESHLWLAACAEANAVGRPIDRWKMVKSHLIECRACALEYGWLLCFALLDEEGLLPAGHPLPALDTSFLFRSRDTNE
jgi:hypothetical protein